MEKLRLKAILAIVIVLVVMFSLLEADVEAKNVKAETPPKTKWTRTYGGIGYEEATCVVQTSDKGYAIAGYTSSYGAGWSDFWLVKTDSDGNKLWDKTYGGSKIDRAYCVVQTSDGGYALAGYTESYGAGSDDFWLVKTDSDGNKLWDKAYGGTGSDWASCVVQTSDGGYALAGYAYSYGAGNNDFWLVRTHKDKN